MTPVGLGPVSLHVGHVLIKEKLPAAGFETDVTEVSRTFSCTPHAYLLSKTIISFMNITKTSTFLVLINFY